MQIQSANGKQTWEAEEIYQTLLANRKPVHIDKEHATYISEPTSFRIYRKNIIDCSITVKEHLSFFKPDSNHI